MKTLQNLHLVVQIKKSSLTKITKWKQETIVELGTYAIKMRGSTYTKQVASYLNLKEVLPQAVIDIHNF